jgi:hypothetical protein
MGFLGFFVGASIGHAVYHSLVSTGQSRFNRPLMSGIQNVQTFLEVLILKGLRFDLSPA